MCLLSCFLLTQILQLSAAHGYVFELPPKAESGAFLQRGMLPKRAALPTQVWQQALGRENGKRNRELKIQKQMVPFSFYIFFLSSSHLDTSMVWDCSLVWISIPKMNTLSLPHHHSRKPFLSPHLSSCQHNGSLSLRQKKPVEVTD